MGRKEEGRRKKGKGKLKSRITRRSELWKDEQISAEADVRSGGQSYASVRSKHPVFGADSANCNCILAYLSTI